MKPDTLQSSPSKALRHRKCRRLSSWTLLHGCQACRDRQLMQSKHIRKFPYEKLTYSSAYPKTRVQTLGYPYQNHAGQLNGRPLRTQCALWKGICMVILSQDFFGNATWRKRSSSLDGPKSQDGNVSMPIMRKDYSCQFMWMTSRWSDAAKICHPCGQLSAWILTLNQKPSYHRTCIWDVIKEKPRFNQK